MPEIYCVNAYKGLRIDNAGNCQLCCKSEELLTNKEGKVAMIDVDDIDDIMHGQKANEIREALQQGIRHPNCKKCWDEEDAGVKSKREHDSLRSIDYWGADYTQNSEISPEIIEFNFGNICNLKCRICGPWSSSQWKKEFFDLHVPNNHAPEVAESYKAQVKHWAGNWTDDSPTWDNIGKYLDKFKKIDIFGGEPFLVQRQWDALETSVKNGWSKYQSLHFNTNGTQYNEENLKLLPEFERVFLSFSIDGIEKKFEHQRHPAVWEEALQNLIAFKALSEKYPSIAINICNTVNIQNVLYIPETMEFFGKLGIPVYMNYCHWPLHYNSKNIPEPIKQKIFEHYENFDDPWIKQNLADVKGFMSSQECDLQQWKKFIDVTERTDVYRNENSRQVFPEFWDLVDSYDAGEL